jgi:hypothetical protein
LVATFLMNLPLFVACGRYIRIYISIYTSCMYHIYICIYTPFFIWSQYISITSPMMSVIMSFLFAESQVRFLFLFCQNTMSLLVQPLCLLDEQQSFLGHKITNSQILFDLKLISSIITLG